MRRRSSSATLRSPGETSRRWYGSRAADPLAARDHTAEDRREAPLAGTSRRLDRPHVSRRGRER
jgi:hypothetical protein